MRNNEYKVVVTGATSFIGKTLIPELMRHYRPNEVLCLAWNKDSIIGRQNRKTIEKYNIPIKEVDLAAAEGLNDLPVNPPIIIHLAANTDTSNKSHRVNDVGTQNLLAAFGNLDSRTHIIHTSTTVFCGGRPDCSKPINELSPTFPTNEYGRTKFTGEKILKDYCREHKVRLTILRLNTTYGANSRPNSFFKLIPEMVRRGSLLSRLNWPGLTSIVYVGDVAKTILTVAQDLPAEPGVPETYVLHSENLTLAEICKTVHKALNKEYKQVTLPQAFWSLVKLCKPVIFRLEKVLPSVIYNPIWRACLIVDNTIYCDASKARQHIPGWQPKTLEETVDLVVANID